jgi:hypothetical protein
MYPHLAQGNGAANGSRRGISLSVVLFLLLYARAPSAAKNALPMPEVFVCGDSPPSAPRPGKFMKYLRKTLNVDCVKPGFGAQ